MTPPDRMMPPPGPPPATAAPPAPPPEEEKGEQLVCPHCGYKFTEDEMNRAQAQGTIPPPPTTERGGKAPLAPPGPPARERIERFNIGRKVPAPVEETAPLVERARGRMAERYGRR